MKDGFLTEKLLPFGKRRINKMHNGYILNFYAFKQNDKGQIAPLILVAIVLFLVIAMVTVDIGESALKRTTIVNATDSAALAAAACASTVINAIGAVLDGQSLSWAGSMGAIGGTAAAITVAGAMGWTGAALGWGAAASGTGPPGWVVFIIIVAIIVCVYVVTTWLNLLKAKRILKNDMLPAICQTTLASAMSGARITVFKPKLSSESMKDYMARETEFDVYMRKPLDEDSRNWYGRYTKVISSHPNDVDAQGWGMFEWRDQYQREHFVTVVTRIRGKDMSPKIIAAMLEHPERHIRKRPRCDVWVAVIRNDPQVDYGFLKSKNLNQDAAEDPAVRDFILAERHDRSGGTHDPDLDEAQFYLLEDLGIAKNGDPHYYFKGNYSFAQGYAHKGYWSRFFGLPPGGNQASFCSLELPSPN